MAVLNSWQKLSRVVSSDFGDGSDGPYSSASIPTPAYEAIASTASSGQKNVTTSGTTLANGDVVLIHQSRGTGVGQWEINKVASGGGSTSIVMQENLHYAYTIGSGSLAQIVVIPQYTTVTVPAGTWTVSTWNQSKYGIFALAANSSVTITGTLSATGVGFKGGPGGQAVGASGQAGEGQSATTTNPTQTSANGTSGAGGGQGDNPNTGDQGGGGAGGGSASSGSNGGTSGARVGGTAGSASSASADLLIAVFGGGGGAGGRDGDGATAAVPAAGNGGGFVAIFTPTISGAGALNVKGGAGGTGGNWNGNSGGGGGGNILIACQTADFSSLTVDAQKGAAGTGGTVAAGAGSDGRIAIHHSGTVTGTTNPTYDDTTDSFSLGAGPSPNYAYYA